MANLQDVIDRLKAEGQLTRNTGTNSIKATNEQLESIKNSINGLNELQQKESQENRRRELELKDNLSEGAGTTGATSQTSMVPKRGGLAKGLGLAGLLAGGAALGAGAIAGLLSFVDFDAEKIKKNVSTLLSIKDEFTGVGDFFAKTGAFFGTMTSLGLGLAAFGIGSAVAGVGEAIAKFSSGDNWAQKIKDNVKVLLSIGDVVPENSSLLAEGGKFFLAMTGIGAGLAAFGVGKAVGGIGDAINKFMGNDNWAQNVVDNVKTLMTLATDISFADAARALVKFPIVLGSIGVGLAAFGAGKAVEGVGTAIQGVSDAVNDFKAGGFAERVVHEVKTLLTLAEIPLKDTASFIATMGGIGAGLAAFSLGKGAEGLTTAMQGVISQFSGKGFAQRIKDEVTSLLSILNDPNVSVEKSLNFLKVMGNIALAITKFAGTKVLDALANLGSGIVNFISGSDSPIQQIKLLADESDRLERAGNALTKIGTALNTFASIKSTKVDFESLSKSIAGSLPLIEGLAQGGYPNAGTGVIKVPGIFSSNIDVPKGGIFDPKLRLDEMGPTMQKIRIALGMEPMQMSSNINQASTEVAVGQRREGVTAPTVVAPTTNNQQVNNTVINRGGGSTITPRRPQITGRGDTLNAYQ